VGPLMVLALAETVVTVLVVLLVTNNPHSELDLELELKKYPLIWCVN